MFSVVVRQGLRASACNVGRRNVTFGAPPPPKGHPVIRWLRQTVIIKWFGNSTVYKIMCNHTAQRLFYWTVLGSIILYVGSMYTNLLFQVRDQHAGSSSMMTPSEMKNFGKTGKQEESKNIMASLVEQDHDDWENHRYPRKEEPETVLAHKKREDERMMKEVERQVQDQLTGMDNKDFSKEDFEYDFDTLVGDAFSEKLLDEEEG